MSASPFIKAAILTIFVAIFAILLVAQLDTSRTRDLKEKIDQVTLESESNRLMSRMAELVPSGESKCDFLNNSGQFRKERAYELALQIQDYQRANFFGSEYESLKKMYFISLTDLYLFTLEQNNKCPKSKEVPVVFFYREKSCPECRTQGLVLERIAPKCSGMRIFAFPVDVEYPFLKLISSNYGLAKTPAIVVGDNTKLEGLQDDAQILSALKSEGASCSQS